MAKFKFHGAVIMINARPDGDKIRLYMEGAVIDPSDGSILVDPDILLQLTCNMEIKDAARNEVNKARQERQGRIARELESMKNGTPSYATA